MGAEDVKVCIKYHHRSGSCTHSGFVVLITVGDGGELTFPNPEETWQKLEHDPSYVKDVLLQEKSLVKMKPND